MLNFFNNNFDRIFKIVIVFSQFFFFYQSISSQKLLLQLNAAQENIDRLNAKVSALTSHLGRLEAENSILLSEKVESTAIIDPYWYWVGAGVFTLVIVLSIVFSTPGGSGGTVSGQIETAIDSATSSDVKALVGMTLDLLTDTETHMAQLNDKIDTLATQKTMEKFMITINENYGMTHSSIVSMVETVHFLARKIDTYLKK